MRIAIDAHMVGERETGNETYVLNLIRALFVQPAVQHGDVEIVLYATHPERLRARLGSEVPARIRRIRPAAAPLRIPFAIPVAASLDQIDLLHVTYVAPPVCPCRYVVTVHDVSFERYPAFVAPRVRLMLKALVPRSVRRASRVITVSEHARGEISDVYSVPADRIAVTYEAAASQYRPIDDPAVLTDVRRKYGLASQYILALGNLQPRKNLATLVEAYARARDRGHLAGVQLVLAGKADWRGSDLFGFVARCGHSDDIRFPGYIANADLPALYAAASAFVYPSLYEGFGLPPLEAMASGTPVICSNAASLPEVIGDAALSFDPHDTAALTEALIRLHAEPERRNALRERGLRQANRFSWTRCAQETLQAYRQALGGASS